MSNKTVAVLFVTALAIVACTAEGPTTPPQTDTIARAPETTPTATPAPGAPTVVDPPATPDHDAVVTKGGAYSVTNTNGFRSFYCAAAFGVLPGGEQGAGTYLEGSQNQGERNDKDVFSGQFPKTAACQYKQIQGDLTQVKDCRNFTWNNVLAAAVWDNPDFIEGTASETLPAVTTYEGEGCTKQKVVTVSKKFKCSGQVVVVSTTKTPAPDPVYITEERETFSGECGQRMKTVTTYRRNSCEQESAWVVFGEPVVTSSPVECCKYPTPSHQLSSLTFPTYTPKLYFYDGDSSFANDCAVDGGTFFASIDSRSNVCRTPNNHGDEWDYNESGDDDNSDDEADRYKTQDASGGNPISGSATVSGAGTWYLKLRTNNTVKKDDETKVLTCNSAPFTLTVSYNWIGHPDEQWYMELYRDNVLVATSAVVNNPSN